MWVLIPFANIKKDLLRGLKNGASEGTESEPIFVNFVQQVMLNTDVIREVKLFLYAQCS